VRRKKPRLIKAVQSKGHHWGSARPTLYVLGRVLGRAPVARPIRSCARPGDHTPCWQCRISVNADRWRGFEWSAGGSFAATGCLIAHSCAPLVGLASAAVESRLPLLCALPPSLALGGFFPRSLGPI